MENATHSVRLAQINTILQADGERSGYELRYRSYKAAFYGIVTQGSSYLALQVIGTARDLRFSESSRRAEV